MGTLRDFNWRHPIKGWRGWRGDRRWQWWEAAEEYPTVESEACFDPLGSYTGISEDEDGVPEQDADDL